VDEVTIFLRFLVDMGLVMWHETDSLRRFVIFDAVSFFVKPATIVICKHEATFGEGNSHSHSHSKANATTTSFADDDGVIHRKDIHNQCMQKYSADWELFVRKGVISAELLRALLDGHTLKETGGMFAFTDLIIELMVLHGLLVSLSTNNNANTNNNTIINTIINNNVNNTNNIYNSNNVNNNSNNTTNSNEKKYFLVPSVLPSVDPSHALTINAAKLPMWPHQSTCIFAFATSDNNIRDYSVISAVDLATTCFLPTGFFERLLGKLVLWSHNTRSEDEDKSR
jgi:hypothetical protein